MTPAAKKPWTSPKLTLFRLPDEVQASFEQVEMLPAERSRVDRLIQRMRRP